MEKSSNQRRIMRFGNVGYKFGHLATTAGTAGSEKTVGDDRYNSERDIFYIGDIDGNRAAGSRLFVLNPQIPVIPIPPGTGSNE